MKAIINFRQLANYIFYIVVVYYLILMYFLEQEIPKYSLLYFLFVVPILVYVALLSKYLLTLKYNRKALAPLLFLGVVTAVSLFRLDFSTIFSTLMFSATLIVIFNSGLSPSIRFVNSIFLLAVAGSIVTFHLGLNRFGYIPDIGADFSGGNVGWRISLFPMITESGFFALLVVVANFYLNPSRSRFLYYSLGFYFLVFSGSRTAMVIFIFFIGFVLITRFFRFCPRILYYQLSPLLVVFFILLLNFKSLLMMLDDTNLAFVNQFVFRSNDGLSQSAELQDVATRTWIWEQHLKIWSLNPVFGIGTYDFNKYKEVGNKAYQRSSGSESFLTAMLARVGLAVVFILYMIFVIQREAMIKRNPFVYLLSFYIVITMISYGSFLVAYNFMFLLLFAMTNTSHYVRS